MASQHLPPSIAVSSADNPPPDPGHYDSHRRMFIGPMPEKVISQTEAQMKKQQPKGATDQSQTEDVRDEISEIIKRNAFNFFIREGGRAEDWGEDEQRNIAEEMFRRWRSSEWAHIWRHRQDNTQAASPFASHWVGGSFEIGRFLGVNLLQPTDASRERPSLSGNSTLRVPDSAAQATQYLPRASLSIGSETFVTAPMGFDHDPTTSRMNGGSENGTSIDIGYSHPASSSTSLLRSHDSKACTEVAMPRPVLSGSEGPSTTAQSDDILAAGIKGKGKLVRYADPPSEEPPPTRSAEVLERTGSGPLQDTNAEAAMESAPLASPVPSSANLEWGDVIMRDRMLIRTYYSRLDSIGSRFDESKHRTTQNLLDADWAEYLVAWRKDRIELYNDYSMPGKEWFKGHKHLAFVIPLKSSRTHLSLYSFVDLTFCITCPPTQPVRDDSKKPFFLRRTREGTNVFIFKHKSRSRAFDWTWLLWRHIGHELPNSIEVRNPRVNTRVTIDIPSGDSDRLARVFHRKNVLTLCTKLFRTVPDWKNLIEREIKGGKILQLAWRQDTNLDWVWLDDDVDGHERPWAVLCGLASRESSRPAILEIRLADHYPTHIHLKNGNRLHEPPAVEGYVERIRPNSQTRQSLYLATHDGNLFVMTPNHAYPPSPPGLAKNIGDIENFADSLRKSEVLRGAMQVRHAIGINDLRTVLAIRRAFHLVPEAMHKEASKSQDSDIWASIWAQSEEMTAADAGDEGGEEGLNKADDRVHMRMRRSFELLLTTGHVVRFETHSCRITTEWIERLRALVLYWKQRHRMDATEEMDLAQSRRPRLTPLTRVHQDNELPPDAPPDMGAPMPALGSLFSWCVLEGCKSIVKGGKLFVRKGLFGQYQLVQLFLSAGHLTQFRIKPNSSLHQTMHRKTSLVDAYVCSGYLAAMALPKGQYRADMSADPRRYQDGLETNDPEEEMLFMIWYHPRSPESEQAKSSKTIPASSGKRKFLVCRTRSRLERDAWCWALNCEIEKLVRLQKERETKLREDGKLIPS